MFDDPALHSAYIPKFFLHSLQLSTSFAPKLARRLHKACLKYEAWKRGNSWKPWLFPEQTLDAPRINLKDVSCWPQ